MKSLLVARKLLVELLREPKLAAVLFLLPLGFLAIAALAAAAGTGMTILDATSRPGQWPIVILYAALLAVLAVLAILLILSKFTVFIHFTAGLCLSRPARK